MPLSLAVSWSGGRMVANCLLIYLQLIQLLIEISVCNASVTQVVAEANEWQDQSTQYLNPS